MNEKLFCSQINEKNFVVKNDAEEAVAHVYSDNERFFAYCAGNRTTCTFESYGCLADALRVLMRQLDQEVCLMPSNGTHIKNRQNDGCLLAWRTSQYGWQLHAQIAPKVRLHTLLGWVQPRKDGRWDWFVKPQKDFFIPPNPDWKLQGVVNTEEGARDVVETYWLASPKATEVKTNV